MTPTRRWGWIYFTVGVLFVVVSAQITDASTDLTQDSALWLNASVFLLLAAFVLEPWYSGSSTTITNALLVVVGVITAGFEDNGGWWIFLLTLAVTSFVVMAVSSLFDARVGPRAGRQLRQFGRTLGSWRVLPLVVTWC